MVILVNRRSFSWLLLLVLLLVLPASAAPRPERRPKLVVILANGSQSRVIAVSNKERAAIMLGGKLGKAYWFSDRQGEMTTSTYYGRPSPLSPPTAGGGRGEGGASPPLPRWLRDLNARRL